MKKKTASRAFVVVRKATGLSQAKFAAAIGVTKATVENIELGRAPISSDLAETIAAFCGVAPQTISSDHPRDFAGAPYSTQSWKRWQEYQYDDKLIQELTEKARETLAILLEAAAKNSAGHQTAHVFRTVLLEFNKFIFALREKHRLESRIDTVMQEKFSDVLEGRTTVAEIDAKLRGCSEWDNKKRQWKRSEPVRYTEQRIQLFVPFIGFFPGDEEDDGRALFLNKQIVTRHIYSLCIKGEGFRLVKHTGRLALMILPETLPPSQQPKRKA